MLLAALDHHVEGTSKHLTHKRAGHGRLIWLQMLSRKVPVLMACIQPAVDVFWIASMVSSMRIRCAWWNHAQRVVECAVQPPSWCLDIEWQLAWTSAGGMQELRLQHLFPA
jgi:hypothetical protein